MKKILGLLLTILAIGLVGCKKDCKTITVCASDVPHAEVLENSVKPYLAEQGYKLKVTILDWTQQNDAVANGDYDANYFQHQPYLSTYTGSTKLAFTCTVHYEPLGIYQGKSTSTDPKTGKTFEICNDISNAVRAFQLLLAKGVLTEISVTANADAFDYEVGTWDATKTNWTSTTGIKVTLVEESLLVSSMNDYDFACLPCNTAYTGGVTSETRVAVEDDPLQVATKANGLAVRVNDYLNNTAYKEKMDILTEALLSSTVAQYFEKQYLGAMTCDASTQIDLRANIK